MSDLRSLIPRSAYISNTMSAVTSERTQVQYSRKYDTLYTTRIGAV